MFIILSTQTRINFRNIESMKIPRKKLKSLSKNAKKLKKTQKKANFPGKNGKKREGGRNCSLYVKVPVHLGERVPLYNRPYNNILRILSR